MMKSPENGAAVAAFAISQEEGGRLQPTEKSIAWLAVAGGHIPSSG
ncbi:hypothetical protein [Novosphingobium sp. PC22D]|nr:hypothetical protein [Novosphingobium sp. PC22D]